MPHKSRVAELQKGGSKTVDPSNHTLHVVEIMDDGSVYCLECRRFVQMPPKST